MSFLYIVVLSNRRIIKMLIFVFFKNKIAICCAQIRWSQSQDRTGLVPFLIENKGFYSTRFIIQKLYNYFNSNVCIKYKENQTKGMKMTIKWLYILTISKFRNQYHFHSRACSFSPITKVGSYLFKVNIKLSKYIHFQNIIRCQILL